MSPDDAYLLHAVKVALQAAAEMDARPKLIIITEPPRPPEHSAEVRAPGVTLH
jgi:hypothetical protein